LLESADGLTSNQSQRVITHSGAFLTLSPRSISVVCCSEIQDPKWRWISALLPETDVNFNFVRCPAGLNFRVLNLARMVGCWRAVKIARIENASIIVTHGPTLAFWCSVFSRLLRVRVRLLAHSFNFARLPGPIKRYWFSLAFGNVDTFVVFSEMERVLYAKLFRIDPRRIDFVHWCVDAPAVLNPDKPIHPGNYVSAIGGNARDYATLFDAAHAMPNTTFVIVARPENLTGLTIPKNVSIFKNIPFEAAMNILLHSTLTVLPLIGSETPCGHVTIVAAMYLGKPIVVTDSTGISDYIKNCETGLTVEMASPSALVKSISSLLNDSGLRLKLAENSKHFVLRHCSPQTIADHFKRWL
jgi:glycosyltransferase involved in cell wall biosynthesis